MKRVRQWLAAVAMLVQPTSPLQAQQPAAWPHGIIAVGDQALAIELRTSGDLAVLVASLPDGRSAPFRNIATVSDAIAILADQRLAFAWPALLDWAGSDLVKLRDRALAHAEQADALGVVGSLPRTQAEQYSGDPAVTAALQHAQTLFRSGRPAEARRLLRQRIAESRAADEALQRDGYGTLILSIRLASTQFETGDEVGALASLASLSTATSLAAQYRLNIDTNRALLLAEAGHSAEALPMVRAALKAFEGEELPEAGGTLHVPDSEANFAWIEACALDGLGRHAEARARMAQIVAHPDEGPLASTTQRARLSGFLCMHDASGLAREFASQLQTAAPGAELFSTMQPDGKSRPIDRDTVRRALADPALAPLLAGKVRMLPAVLQPAVAEWRSTTTPVLDERGSHR